MTSVPVPDVSAVMTSVCLFVFQDRYWNPDEFPKSFVRGGWEGMWWAFVTMTTVG